MTALFHAHLETCAQCRNHPFDLCAEGERLLMGDRSDYRAHLRRRLTECDVPASLHAGLVEYFAARWETGGFLRAVLENDLRMAAMRADIFNAPYLVHLVRFLISFVPSHAWGSPEAVDAWLGAQDTPQEVFE